MTKNKLKECRLALKLSQDQLGKELGISRVMVGLLERGERPIQKQTGLAVECLIRRDPSISTKILSNAVHEKVSQNGRFETI